MTLGPLSSRRNQRVPGADGSPPAVDGPSSLPAASGSSRSLLSRVTRETSRVVKSPKLSVIPQCASVPRADENTVAGEVLAKPGEFTRFASGGWQPIFRSIPIGLQRPSCGGRNQGCAAHHDSSRSADSWRHPVACEQEKRAAASTT